MAETQGNLATSEATHDGQTRRADGVFEHQDGCRCSTCDCKHCGGKHHDDFVTGNGQGFGINRVDLRQIVKLNEQRHLDVLTTHEFGVNVLCLQPNKVANYPAHDTERLYLVASGKGRVQIELAWTSLEKGDLFTVPADSAFALSSYAKRPLKIVVITSNS